MGYYKKFGKSYFQLPFRFALGVSCFVKKRPRIRFLAGAAEYIFTFIDYLIGRKISKTWYFDEIICSNSYFKTYHYLLKHKDTYRFKTVLININDSPKADKKDFSTLPISLCFTPKKSKIIKSDYEDVDFLFYYIEDSDENLDLLDGRTYLYYDNSRITSKSVITKKYQYI